MLHFSNSNEYLLDFSLISKKKLSLFKKGNNESIPIKP